MSAIRIGNAPCSWGSLEFDGMKGKSVGYEQMLDELVETGYVGTELGDWGFMPTDPGRLGDELAKRDVTMLGAFVPVALKNPESHAEGEAQAVKTAKLLSAVARPDSPPFLILADANGTDPVRTKNAGRVLAHMELNTAQWRVFAQGAERIARAVRDETGLRTAFHHHCAGYVETPDETARLLAFTDPSLLGLVLDTGHYAYGGGGDMALEAIHHLHSRIWHVHFKDCDPKIASKGRFDEWDYFESVRHGVFCELGRGCVDFHAVLDSLRAHRYAGWIVVEQDVLPGMGTPKESARRNREYLHHIGI